MNTPKFKRQQIKEACEAAQKIAHETQTDRWVIAVASGNLHVCDKARAMRFMDSDSSDMMAFFMPQASLVR